MLAYQLMLTVKRGLPLSRLLTNQKTEARSSEAELQAEEFTSPPLKVKEEVVIKEESQLLRVTRRRRRQLAASSRHFKRETITRRLETEKGSNNLPKLTPLKNL